MSEFHMPTFVEWQRRLRQQTLKDIEPSMVSGKVKTVKRRCVKRHRSSTPDLSAPQRNDTSILTEDWFNGFTPKDELFVDDPDGDEVERVTDELGWYVGVIEHYLAPRRTQQAIEIDEAIVAELHAEPPVAKLSQREVAVLEQRRIVIECQAQAKRHYFRTLRSNLPQEFRLKVAGEKAERDPQVEAAKRHAEALRQAMLLRERLQAYGVKQPTRSLMVTLAREYGAVRPTYAEVNRVFRFAPVTSPADLAA